MIFFRYIALILLLIGCNRVQYVPNTELPQRAEPLTLTLSGDYMQHGPQVRAARTKDGFDYTSALKFIAPLWKNSDFALINLETTLTNNGRYTGYPLFASPIEIAAALKNSGITHIALANNHAMDRGLSGVKQTIAELEKVGLTYIGVYLDKEKAQSTTMLEKNGVKVALINYTYGTNGMPTPKGVHANSTLDTAKMRSEIIRAQKSGATHIAAILHWGNEYQRTPSTEQKKLALWLRKNGATVVIGSHPHVAQPIDGKNRIIYSLGNFTSNQQQLHTDAGYSVKLSFYEGKSRPKIEYTPHFVDLTARGVNKYRVLTPQDSTHIENATQRARMNRTIENVRQTINTKVEYRD